MKYAVIVICALAAACSNAAISAPDVFRRPTSAARVSIERGPFWVAPGCPVQLRAHVFGADGAELSEPAGWFSDRPELATIDLTGQLVTLNGGGGFSNSLVLVHASPAPHVEDTITVFVEASSYAMRLIDLTGNVTRAAAGDSAVIAALINGNGDTPFITEWTSSDTAVATIVVDERFGRDFKPQHGHAVAMVFWHKAGSVTLSAKACDGATTSETVVVR
ncbi:MAG: hypothetical protein ABJD07_15200 [Gemmatimonadaceae bacterium]